MTENEDAEMLVLRNDNFIQNHKRRFRNFLQSENFSDVTLACNGQFVKSHRLVLASSSPFFSDMFNMCGSKDPIVVLNDVSSYHMKAILQYIYTGECQVQQDEVMTFLKVADSLLIYGLHDKDKDRRKAPSNAANSTPVTEEETSCSVATPRMEREEEPPSVEHVNIKEEIPDVSYMEFEHIDLEPQEMNNPPARIPYNTRVSNIQESEMVSGGIMQTSTDDVFSMPVSVSLTESDTPAFIPNVALSTVSAATTSFLPKPEEEELDGHNEDYRSYGAAVADDDDGVEDIQDGDQPQRKRKRTTMDDYRGESYSDEGEEMGDSSCSQPGPSNPPSTSGDPTPSTSQDKKRSSQTIFYVRCVVCKKTFCDNYSLKKHYTNVHELPTDRLTCPVCKKSYKNEHTLKMHKIQHHK